MNRPTTAVLTLTLLGVLGSACVSGAGGPQTTVQGGESMPGMVELDGGQVLMRDLEITGLTQVRRNDFLTAQFDLQNKRGSSLALEWTVDWYDSHGMKIDTNESWRPIVLGGRGFETLQITAPTQDARSWRLKVQKPNPVR